MIKRRPGWLIMAAALPILALLGVRWLSARARPAHAVGARDGRLAPCPDSPNCVSSQALSPDQQIEPLPWTGSAEQALQRLQGIVASLPRSTIVTAESNYLHAEFRTAWLGFVDDVEFLIDTAAGVIHVRSAARLGHSDLGVNRQRLEAIRQQFLVEVDPPSRQ